jgi:hypothetical protein
MRVRSSAVFLAPLLCACYVTTPLVSTRPDPGTKLRVQLTDVGSDNLARYLGPGVTTVDGRLLQNSDSALALSVTQVAMRSGQEQFWKGEQVELPRASIAAVQERRLSKTRSVLLAGGIVAALLSLKISGAVGGSSSRGGGAPGTK